MNGISACGMIGTANEMRYKQMADILVQGLTQNNLKHVSFRIPREK